MSDRELVSYHKDLDGKFTQAKALLADTQAALGTDANSKSLGAKIKSVSSFQEEPQKAVALFSGTLEQLPLGATVDF